MTGPAAPQPSRLPGRGSHRTAARLAAAQVLYEMEMAGAPADAVLADHLADRWREIPVEGDEDGTETGSARTIAPDRVHLGAVVRGAVERRADIDRMIEGALNKGWTVARLEALLRAILRCGTYEILALRDVPPRVVISEYVDVAKAFYAGSEPALVNGILDRLAHVLRAEAFEPTSGPGAAQGGGEGHNRTE